MINEKKLGKLFAAILIAGMLSIVSVQSLVSPVKAASEEDIEDSIVLGLEWLAPQQQADGSWLYYEGDPDPCYDVAVTSLVVLKFVDRAKELGLDPFETDDGQPDYYEYASNVIAGYDYIFSQTMLDAEDRVYFDCLGIYNTGAAMMAIATSNVPDKIVVTTGGASVVEGWTYLDVLQSMMDYMIDAQNDDTDTYDCDVGGWGYVANYDGWSDQSNSGYATLGLGFAAAEPTYGFGLDIPQEVLDKLSIYIDNIQDPVDGDSYDGGAWYEPCEIYKWVNILKTGNLLYQMALVGDDVGDTRVQDAIDYIENHWSSTGPQPEFSDTSLGWMDSYQAMFAMMKGLVALGINDLDVGMGSFDWFEEVSTVIVDHQNPAGYFDLINPSYPYEGEESTVLRTAWALLTLEKFVPIIQSFTVEKDFRYTSVEFTPYHLEDPDGIPDSGDEYMVQDLAILGDLLPTSIHLGPDPYVVLEENFEGSWLPTGWTTTILPGYTYTWDQNIYTNYAGSGICAEINSDYYYSGCGGELISPSMDLTSAVAAELQFGFYFDGSWVYEEFRVDVWDGTTWTNEYLTSSYYSGTLTIDLTDYCGNSDVKVRFVYEDFGNWGYYPQVDDVTIYAKDNEYYDVSVIVHEKTGKVKSTNPGQLYGVISITGSVSEVAIMDTFDDQFDVNPAHLGGGVEVIMVDQDGYATILTYEPGISADVDNDANEVEILIDLIEATGDSLPGGCTLMVYVKFQTTMKHELWADFDEYFVNTAEVYINDMEMSEDPLFTVIAEIYLTEK